MNVCPKCQQESADEAAFCGFCGQKMQEEKQKKTLYGVSAISKKELLAGAKQAKAASAAKRSASIAEAAKKSASIAEAAKKSASNAKAVKGSASNAKAASNVVPDTSVTLKEQKISWPVAPPPNAQSAKELELRVEDLQREASSASDTWGDLDKSAPPLAVSTEASAGHAEPVPAVGRRESVSHKKSPLSHADMVAPTQPMQTYDAEKLVRHAPRDTVRTEKTPAKAAPVSTLSAIDLDDEPDGPAYPSPVAPKADPKAGEMAFFGATLSRYGMAPVQKLPDMTSEMKRARTRSFVLLFFGVVVLGAILGAIGYMMSMGE